MNFLAHIYLSGENELLKIGNFMADSIRGNQYLTYPNEIQKGVLLHRHIDSFTDFHPIYRKSKHRLHEKYGHYSGVIMDIMYDHFLAKNWNTFSEIPIEKYAASFYELLQKEESLLTERTKNMIPYMIAQNWLVSYASLEGLETILFQMDYRTKNRVNMPEAMKELKQFETEFETEFFAFFDELQVSCQQKLIELETY
jgi:acyl carrier protein phosphodiesterase